MPWARPRGESPRAEWSRRDNSPAQQGPLVTVPGLPLDTPAMLA
jgi:hypothetical protein